MNQDTHVLRWSRWVGGWKVCVGGGGTGIPLAISNPYLFCRSIAKMSKPKVDISSVAQSFCTLPGTDICFMSVQIFVQHLIQRNIDCISSFSRLLTCLFACTMTGFLLNPVSVNSSVNSHTLSTGSWGEKRRVNERTVALESRG